MSKLVVELLHLYTRTLDVNGASPEQELFLSKEAKKELLDDYCFYSRDDLSSNNSNEFIIRIDGYKFKIKTNES